MPNVASNVNFVQVENLDLIISSLNKSGPAVAKAMKLGLIEAAEPVKRDADRLSLEGLSGMKRAKKKPPPWSIQKVGQTIHEVYIAPTQRGRRFYRTDGDRRRAERFVELMLGKAYEPALEQNEQLVHRMVDNWLGKAIGEV